MFWEVNRRFCERKLGFTAPYLNASPFKPTNDNFEYRSTQ